VAKFAASVIDTSGKFTTGVVDTGAASWVVNISANFRKNSKKPDAKNLVICNVPKVALRSIKSKKCPTVLLCSFFYLLTWQKSVYCQTGEERVQRQEF
jgi:hypothetical protein